MTNNLTLIIADGHYHSIFTRGIVEMNTKCYEAEYGIILNDLPAIETRRWKHDLENGYRWGERVVGYRYASVDEMARANGMPREVQCDTSE